LIQERTEDGDQVGRLDAVLKRSLTGLARSSIGLYTRLVLTLKEGMEERFDERASGNLAGFLPFGLETLLNSSGFDVGTAKRAVFRFKIKKRGWK
jgi:hypothetical protein